jgi:hypothetical protein
MPIHIDFAVISALNFMKIFLIFRKYFHYIIIKCLFLYFIFNKKISRQGRLSERDSSGCRPKGGSTKRTKGARRYERSEPRIARRERNKNSRNCFAVRLFFMERSGSPKFNVLIC